MLEADVKIASTMISSSIYPKALHLFTAVKMSMSYTAEPSNHSDPKALAGGKIPGQANDAKRAFERLSDVVRLFWVKSRYSPDRTLTIPILMALST